MISIKVGNVNVCVRLYMATLAVDLKVSSRIYRKHKIYE